jgi:putative oxidoreductase
MKSEEKIQLISSALVILFSYTALSKLADFQDFHRQLLNQVFPNWLADILWILLPLTEISICILLVIKTTRLIGLYLSIILMTAFTVYMALVVLNIFDRVPCSCGGVLKSMGFTAHFFFNLFFLILAVWAFRLSKQQNIKGYP